MSPSPNAFFLSKMEIEAMSLMHIEASSVIDAPPEDVYAVMSDYRVGHPAILPKPYFTSLSVVEGGTGAGTVINVDMKVMGVEAHYHMTVSEPEQGRVLVETDETAGVVTTFTFDAIDSGSKTHLIIATEMKASPGVKGFVEKLINPPITRRIYKKELQNIGDYMKTRPKSP